MIPYYVDESVTLYIGDMRHVLPWLSVDGPKIDACVTDPPYGETSLSWDRWPEGWPALVAEVTSSLWCFGSMRMFLEQRDEFAAWRLSQDVVWEKPMGTGPQADRFMRVHEHATHWYRGSWKELPKFPQREQGGVTVRGGGTRPASRMPTATGAPMRAVEWTEDGQRLLKSVLRAPNMRHHSRHPTEKPTGILDPLIAYSCPPGGTVLDPFAGSGSTLDAARCSGRKAVGVEASEVYCEIIALRLSQGSLFSDTQDAAVASSSSFRADAATPPGVAPPGATTGHTA